MKKIEFKNLPDKTTPINTNNLNLLQDNVEKSFKSEESTSTMDTYSCNYLNTHLNNYKSIKNVEYIRVCASVILNFSNGQAEMDVSKYNFTETPQAVFCSLQSHFGTIIYSFDSSTSKKLQFIATDFGENIPMRIGLIIFDKK